MKTPIQTPSRSALLDLVLRKHDGDVGRFGWGTRMRMRFEYFTPDEVYEATISQLVAPGCAWLDVGCGRHVFPGNPTLARVLADRAGVLVGVDPDPTLDENPFVHEKVKGDIAGFDSDRAFDLVTLRMVAEHIADPRTATEALARLTKPGGKVVVYTVNRWSPASLVSWFLPFGFHHPIKRLLWKTEEKDTFPVAYRMNTRSQLRRLFKAHGLHEYIFSYLDDCRTFANFRPLLFLELGVRHLLGIVGLGYPENCLLGVYERPGSKNLSCNSNTCDHHDSTA